MTTPANGPVPEFWVRNRESVVVGMATSAAVGLVFWLIPGVSTVIGIVAPIVQTSRIVQFVLAICVGLCASWIPYHLGLGARRLERGREQPAPADLQGAAQPVSPAPKRTWPEFDRSDLIADCKILVVDDASPDKLAMFERRGFKLELRQSVEHDAEKPYETQFDLLLLDLRGVGSEFGASKGNEALPLLRRDNPWLPIVIFTSFQQDLKGPALAEVEALSEGVLRKSLRYDELEERILEVLQRSRSRGTFRSLLEKFGVTNAEHLIEAAVDGHVGVADIEFAPGDGGAMNRESARRVIQAAVRVLAAARARAESRAMGIARA